MKWIVRLIRGLSEVINGWILAGAVAVLLLIIFFVWVSKSGRVRRPGIRYVKTRNGAVLICQCFDREHYQLVGIKKQRRHIILPQTVDGVHKLTDINMNEGENRLRRCKRVRHIHLSATVTNINGKVMRNGYHMNPFFVFPHLKSITVEEENPRFRAEKTMLYQGESKLAAVAPGHVGPVYIGEEIKKIAVSALLDLSTATAFEVAEGNEEYKSADGVLYSKNGKSLLRYPIRKIGPEFTIPEGIRKIKPEAFYSQRYLHKVIMPHSLKRIGRSAFDRCRLLQRVVLNENLQILEERAFLYTKVRELVLPESLRTAEIGSIPAKELILPENLGDISFYDEDDGNRYLRADRLIIKNPALDLEELENEEGKDSVYSCKKIFAYEGSLPYRQIEKVKDAYLIDLYVLPGKKFEEPPQHIGPVNTRWFFEDKDEFSISTPAELAGLSVLCEKELEHEDITIHLKADLDMSQYPNFKPIASFGGTFDGGGHTISNLHIYRPTENRVGLFRSISWGATIKDLHVQGEVTGGNFTGGIVGEWDYFGELENCTFEGKVKGYGYSGKKVGYNRCKG